MQLRLTEYTRRLQRRSRVMILSIIIINFNTYKYLARCLSSIFKSELRRDSYEIIVVDNASKDDSVNQLIKDYPHIRLIVNKKNIGFAKANNQALKKASGEYILFLNPDTIILKNSLSVTLNFMKKHGQAGVATCRVKLSEGRLDDACHRGFPTPWNALCQFTGLALLFPGTNLFNGYHLGYRDLDKIHEIDSCSGAFMLVRREAGSKIDWFDKEYFWYGEDLDFCYRIKEKGWKIFYIPEVKIIHYKGVASGIKKHSRKISSADKETKLLATKARFEVMRIFYRKHYQGKYPPWLTSFILMGIRVKEWLTFKYYAHWN